MASFDKIKLALANRAAACRRLFQTEDGKVLMEALEAEFVFGTLLGESPERTAFNLGARDVVLYLRALRDEGKQ